MQLGIRLSRPLTSTILLIFGLMCLVIGSEAFFRYAEWPLAKLLSSGLIIISILVSGIAEWSFKEFAVRSIAAVAYGVYLAQACWRFTGLAKDPGPYMVIDVACFVLRVELILAVPMLATALITGYWMSRGVGNSLYSTE